MIGSMANLNKVMYLLNRKMHTYIPFGTPLQNRIFEKDGFALKFFY
jgi:hypothetical protein